MQPAILEGNLLKLPERIARRLRGTRIQITEMEDGILLKPTGHPIAEAKGFLKGRGFTSAEYLDMKKEDNIRITQYHESTSVPGSFPDLIQIDVSALPQAEKISQTAFSFCYRAFGYFFYLTFNFDKRQLS